MRGSQMNKQKATTILSAVWLAAIVGLTGYGLVAIVTTPNCPPEGTSLEWDSCMLNQL
jgi:hypothetical protein